MQTANLYRVEPYRAIKLLSNSMNERSSIRVNYKLIIGLDTGYNLV